MEAESYYLSLETDRQEPLSQLRAAIKELYPNIKETMGYRMPTYVLEEQALCALASQKNYMSLYIMPYDFLDEFSEELNSFNCGKSCIRFKRLTEEDLELFKRILKYCGDNYEHSSFYGRMNPKKK